MSGDDNASSGCMVGIICFKGSRPTNVTNPKLQLFKSGLDPTEVYFLGCLPKLIVNCVLFVIFKLGMSITSIYVSSKIVFE